MWFDVYEADQGGSIPLCHCNIKRRWQKRMEHVHLKLQRNSGASSFDHGNLIAFLIKVSRMIKYIHFIILNNEKVAYAFCFLKIDLGSYYLEDAVIVVSFVSV